MKKTAFYQQHAEAETMAETARITVQCISYRRYCKNNGKDHKAQTCVFNAFNLKSNNTAYYIYLEKEACYEQNNGLISYLRHHFRKKKDIDVINDNDDAIAKMIADMRIGISVELGTRQALTRHCTKLVFSECCTNVSKRLSAGHCCFNDKNLK